MRRDRRWLPVLLCTALQAPYTASPAALPERVAGRGAAVAPARRDLDVGIPPGSPTSWGRRFPAITPGGGRLFPVTPGGSAAKRQTGRTVAHPRTVAVDLRAPTSFGIVRILTWDLTAHLRWITGRPAEHGPVTGLPAQGPPLPRPGKGVYWTSMAALLRLLLHPQLVSEHELLAHLVEVGEPVLGVLDAAASERALAAPCRKLQAMIGARRSLPRALPGKTPRRTMLKRFLAEELVRAYPYDPEGAFGRRIFVFADELEPFLVEYTAHPDSFLRRNAVAALGRYRSAAAVEALAAVAAATPDPVVLLRALAALGNYRSLRDPGPLLARLDKTSDPVELVALIAAIGRMGIREAVPALLARGARARRGDSDLLMAVLAALARIRHDGPAAAVAKFAGRIAHAARARPGRFAVRPAHAAPAPDAVDAKTARGEILGQLALLLRVRLDARDVKAAERVLALLTTEPAEDRPLRGRRRYASRTLRRVHPPVQLLFLETLRDLGKPGIAGLQAVAADPSVEPALRGYAMSQLPYEDRGLAATAVLDGGRDPELKIYAFEILAGDGHDRLAEFGRELLADCARSAGGAGSSEQRFLWLSALRALERRHLLRTSDLLPLLVHPAARRVSSGKVDRRVLDGLGRLVRALVEDAARRLRKGRLDARIDEILDLVVEHRINPRITAVTRDNAHRYVAGQLGRLKKRKGDRRYKDLVRRAVLDYVRGFAARPGLGRPARFSPVVLLEEEILLALGRTGEAAAGAALVAFLRDHPKNPYRAYACLGIGMTGRRDLARHLVPVLLDEDGFTRFCAYEALRHLTRQEFWADWMYGARRERFDTAERYRAWVARNR